MSPRTHPVRAVARCLIAVGAGLAAAAGSTLAPAAWADLPDGIDPVQATGNGIYLVTLDAAPAALHRKTRPEPGHRFDRSSPDVRDRVRLLRKDQDRILAEIGEPEALYHYTIALDGFAAELDESQVKQLRHTAGVALVERSTTRATDQDSSDFLGLEGDSGVWARNGGADDAGRGKVIGVVDSGIWPENPSFAGLPQQEPGTSTGLPGFHGACAEAESWSGQDCNDKVVSARWFVRGFGTDELASTEVLSARDTTGHGSHAASNAAGERDVRVQIDGQSFGRDNGMAPAARLAVYKACWTAPDPADDGCTTADTVAAIDRAVSDGVDVLSYSVSGSQNPADTVSRAFLGASAAGVFVAASAGNSGPAEGTVGNAAPWITTVGASTHRLYQGAVRAGDGTSYVGAMTSERTIPSSPVVLAEDAALDAASPEDARLCRTGALDAGVVQDKIVICDRGVTPRVEKSAAVARAGGVGMVLANTSADSTDADVHAVPTVHLDVTDAAGLKAYVRAQGDDATVSLDPTGSKDVQVPSVAPFSARGPLPGGDLIKPDLTAPGVGVVGAVAPPAASGRLWDLASGTSVSAPHVAGLAALVLGVHPGWTPAQVKSAMMTTAYPIDGDARPFAQGSGHVDPTAFLDPGLVLESGPGSWRRYVDGDVRPQELNLASVSVGSLVGRTTVKRRVTNIADTTETYTAAVSGMPGLDVRVRPQTVTLASGESHRLKIRFSAASDAAVDTFSKGTLTLTGLSHQVRVPLAVRPVDVDVPGAVGGTGGSGEVVVRGRSGTGERVRLSSTGLVPANPVGVTLRPGPFDPADPQEDGDTFATDVTVPDGTDAARFELDGDNVDDDVDVYVYRDGELAQSATRESAAASVTMLDPTPGDYQVYVHSVHADNDATTTSRLSTWVVDQDGGSHVALTPGSSAIAPGGTFDYTASWDGLDPTRSWFGVVRYDDAPQSTILRIN